MRKRFFWVGLVLGGLGWVYYINNFYSEFWLLLIAPPFLLVGYGGAIGFVIGDVIDDIRKRKRIIQIKKRCFWTSFIVGGLGFFLWISQIEIGLFEPLSLSLGVGLLVGIVGYIIGVVIDDRKRPKEKKQSEVDRITTQSKPPVLRRPTTRLGWWAVGLFVASVVIIVMPMAFIDLTKGGPWLLTIYGYLMILCGLAAGVVGLIAIIRKHERSWLVWLSILPGASVLFLLLYESLVPY